MQCILVTWLDLAWFSRNVKFERSKRRSDLCYSEPREEETQLFRTFFQVWLHSFPIVASVANYERHKQRISRTHPILLANKKMKETFHFSDSWLLFS